ncbi:MAG: VanZ family protein [Planctomycetaceae bacterium]
MLRRRWLTVILCVLWAASIFATSSTVITPHTFFAWFRKNIFDDPESFRQFQVFWAASWLFVVKGWHVTEFAILTVLTTRATDVVRGNQTSRNVLIAAGLCVVYAASDEWHQTFVPKRGGVFSDVLIDCFGIAMAALVLFRNRRRP